jgi:hypothetical protein
MTLVESLVDLFDDPSTVWNSVFDSHLDDLGRRLVLTLATLPGEVFLDELALVVNAQASAPENLARLEATLRTLDDTLVTIHQSWGGEIYLDWRNPGILDFAQMRIEHNPELLGLLWPFLYYEQLDVIAGLALETVRDPRSGARKPSFPRIRHHVSANSKRYVKASIRLYKADSPANALSGLSRLRSLLRIITFFQASIKPKLRRAAEKLLSQEWAAIIAAFEPVKIAQFLASEDVRQGLVWILGEDPAPSYTDDLISTEISINVVEALEELRSVVDVSEEVVENVRNRFGEFLRSHMDAVRDYNDVDDLTSEKRDIDALNYWLSEDDLNEFIDVYETQLEGFPSEPNDEYDDVASQPAGGPTGDDTDMAIEQLFETLTDR